MMWTSVVTCQLALTSFNHPHRLGYEKTLSIHLRVPLPSRLNILTTQLLCNKTHHLRLL